jgi:hypothetical protein
LFLEILANPALPANIANCWCERYLLKRAASQAICTLGAMADTGQQDQLYITGL